MILQAGGQQRQQQRQQEEQEVRNASEATMPKDVPAQRFWAALLQGRLTEFDVVVALSFLAREAALLQDFGSLAQGRLTEFDVVVALSFLAREAALLQDFGSLAQGRLTEFDVVVALSFFDEGSHFGNGCLASVLVM
ncbi:hypothetical protein AK812_SmicGene32788 [Symbiodinium microadriaticum]|uniref:Uncharacterized protein n=1 Tax=Symbiodinium microadriaticum TaxID=2951 RepID=A0A1Q9CT79_SYMMI|nr:hypothetical protein AK812_SmicGene32788 [Symbiodinium microadriaticum]